MNTIQGNITAPTQPEQASTEFLIGLIIFKCISIVFGVLGNIAVIIFNVSMSKEKSPTTWLIVNLSITDLLACLTVYPIWIVELIRIVAGVQSDEEFFCKFIYSSGGVSIVLSILTLLAISFDRYLFITWPLKYPIIMTWRRVRILVCIIWIWALALFPFSLMYIGTGEVRGVCRTWNYKFILFSFIIYIYIPLTLIIFFNYKIYKIAQRHRQRIAASSIAYYNQRIEVPNCANDQVIQAGSCNTEQNEQVMQAGSCNTEQNEQVISGFNAEKKAPWHRITKELKPLKTFVIVIGVLLCCFIPYSIAVSLDKFVFNCVPVTLHIIFSELMTINSIINPFIYGIRHKKYRNAYGRLLTILCSIFKFAK